MSYTCSNIGYFGFFRPHLCHVLLARVISIEYAEYPSRTLVRPSNPTPPHPNPSSGSQNDYCTEMQLFAKFLSFVAAKNDVDFSGMLQRLVR
jgi:hypothetical protein